jgi:hypothetical protein
MREWVNTSPEVHKNKRHLFDILFQLYWIITLVAVKINIVHGDFHIDQILVERLPVECTRRYIVYNAEKKFIFSYSSNWNVCIVDWALSSAFIPYTRSRSASSLSRRTQSNPIGSFPFPNTTYIFAIIDDVMRANKKAYGKLGTFIEMPAGLTFFRMGMFDVLDPKKSFSHDLNALENLTKLKFGLYFDWSRPDNALQLSQPIPRPASRRGRPRKYANNAERKKAYRQRKAGVISTAPVADPDANSDEESLSLEEASYPRIGVLYDLFGLIYDTTNIFIQNSMICNSLGVFASQNVPSGTRLTEYCGQILSRDEIKGLDEWQKTHLRALSKMHSSIDGIRLPQVFLGVGSFVNSSDGTNFQPNAKFSVDHEANKAYIISIRDILQGEEILVDYNYDWKEMEPENELPKAPTKKRAREANVAARSPRKRYKKDNS